jgi:CxxC motif-containing protein (DUF1111 family)
MKTMPWSVRWGVAGATLALAFLASSGGSALRAQSPPNFSQAHAFLGPDDHARFEEGLEEFSAVETVEDGVGPVFNDNSCGACHTQGGIGGGSTILETRFGRITNGVFDPLAQFGGSLQQLKGIGDLGGGCNFFTESILGGANVVARRRTQPLFGLGLVDATAESTFQQIINSQPAAQRGRMNRVQEIVSGRTIMGKFGWKAQVPTLFQFSADAYLNEMGITSPQFPNESCPNGNCELLARCNPVPELNDDGEDVELFRDFMIFLAAPPRGPINATVTAGEAVFNQIGCATCHVATLTTSANAAEPGLRNRTYHPYSDFLLHDMGSAGDQIGAMGIARLSEMRTQPLWGLRVVTRFMHDSRADTIPRAVENHAGQATQARDRFNNLPAAQKTQIMAFLNSL